MRKILLAAILALGIAAPARADFDFRTTGTNSARVWVITCTPSAAPAVSSAGMTKLFVPCSGISGYSAGNTYISQNGGSWQLLSSFLGAGAIVSVFGRTGTIVATAGDYGATLITFTPSGGIAATNVGAAITELDTEKSNLASPTFTGDPKAPTPLTADNDTSIATTAYVKAQGYTSNTGDVTGPSSSVDSELALFSSATGKVIKRATGTGLALVTSGVFSTFTTSAALAGAISDETGTAGSLVFSASPAFTGTPTAPTASAGTNTTQIATTAFVQGGYLPLTGGSLTGNVSSTGTIGVGTTAGTARGIFRHPAGTTSGILQLEQLQTTNDRGGYISFLGGTSGTTSRGFLGMSHSGTGGSTIFTSETADSIGLRAEGALHLGSGGDNIRLTLSSAGNATFSGTITERGLSVPMGEWTNVSYSGSNFTGNGSMTWTVDSGDQVVYGYNRIGKTLRLMFSINASSISGTPNNTLQIAIPGGFTAAYQTYTPSAIYLDNSLGSPFGVAYVGVAAGGTVISIKKLTDANWTASTNQTSVYGEVTIPIQ